MPSVMDLRMDPPPSRLGHPMFVYSGLDDRYCVAATHSWELFQSFCADALRIRHVPVVDLGLGFGTVFLQLCFAASRPFIVIGVGYAVCSVIEGNILHQQGVKQKGSFLRESACWNESRRVE